MMMMMMISPALQQLHWLPVNHRVTFNIATKMHHILQNIVLSLTW